MTKVHPQARLVGFATIALVLLLAMAFTLHLWYMTQSGHETVLVRFDGSGELIGALQPDDPVLVRGVNVGQVEAIAQVPGGVRVLLRFWKHQALFQDALAVNTSHSLMGQRVVDLYPGRDSLHPLSPDQTVPGTFDAGIAETMSKIYKVLDVVVELRKAIVLMVQGGEADQALAGRIMGVMDGVDEILSSLERLGKGIDASAPLLERIGTQTRVVAGALPGLERDLATSLHGSDTVLVATKRTLDAILPLLDSTVRWVHAATDTTGPLRPILLDDSFVESVNRLVDGLNTLMTVLEGRVPIKFRFHILGSNPSKRGE